MYVPNPDTDNSELPVQFDTRIDSIDDFNDRIIIERLSNDKQPQPGRRSRDEEPLYLSLKNEELDRFTGDNDPDNCPECGIGSSDDPNHEEMDLNNYLVPLTPIKKLGYNMHCRACGGLLTQLRHVPVEGLVFLEDHIEKPTE